MVETEAEDDEANVSGNNEDSGYDTSNEHGFRRVLRPNRRNRFVERPENELTACDPENNPCWG